MIYQVLLILTDGAIHDMSAVKDLIVGLAGQPCSIIIVGIGNADFSMMDELDGDHEVITDSSGNRIKRDIVQFVRLNDCLQRGNLAEEVLKEIPEQMSHYMESINFKL
jgi:hypothetical protein